MRIEDITIAAMSLPTNARALLADRLVESLDPAEESALHRLWAAEGQRRLQELRSGSVKGIPGEEAMERVRNKYANRSKASGG